METFQLYCFAENNATPFKAKQSPHNQLLKRTDTIQDFIQ